MPGYQAVICIIMKGHSSAISLLTAKYSSTVVKLLYTVPVCFCCTLGSLLWSSTLHVPYLSAWETKCICKVHVWMRMYIQCMYLRNSLWLSVDTIGMFAVEFRWMNEYTYMYVHILCVHVHMLCIHTYEKLLPILKKPPHQHCMQLTTQWAEPHMFTPLA